MIRRWLRQVRRWLLPITSATAQRRVDAIEQTLARLRAERAALPPEQRDTLARDIQALMIAQASARNQLSDALDERAER